MHLQPLDVPNLASWDVFQALFLSQGAPHPFEEVGGDAIFEDVGRLDGRHLFLVVDVMGHGRRANRLVQDMRDVYLPLLNGQDVGPAELLKSLNEYLQAEFVTSGIYATGLAVLVDAAGVVTASNACLPDPWLEQPGAGWNPWTPPGGGLLGVTEPDTDYEEGSTILSSGWKLLIVTDGVTEAGRGRQPQLLFSNGPLAACLGGLPGGLTAGQVVVRLLQALQIHAGAAWPEDDTTVLCLQRR